jgi:hypothetical protein
MISDIQFQLHTAAFSFLYSLRLFRRAYLSEDECLDELEAPNEVAVWRRK